MCVIKMHFRCKYGKKKGKITKLWPSYIRVIFKSIYGCKDNKNGASVLDSIPLV